MTERAQSNGKRLFVAVDSRSTDAETFEVECIERAFFSEVSARFGGEWGEMNQRAYRQVRVSGTGWRAGRRRGGRKRRSNRDEIKVASAVGARSKAFSAYGCPVSAVCERSANRR